MENTSTKGDAQPNPYRWVKSKNEVTADKAAGEARRASMALDLAAFTLALFAADEPNPVARRVKSNIVGNKLNNAQRWRRLLSPGQ
ncbi:MAG TPA: hypothetical protein VD735_02820 [Candidatus Saccharimonadales bacterium]|nr:hypothetical protein [Candidatus Saccharimonadales bacterium]